MVELVLREQPAQPGANEHERDGNVLQVLGGPRAAAARQMFEKDVGGPVEEDEERLDALHGDGARGGEAEQKVGGPLLRELCGEADPVPRPAVLGAEPAVARERDYAQREEHAALDPVRQEIEDADALTKQVAHGKADDHVCEDVQEQRVVEQVEDRQGGAR